MPQKNQPRSQESERKPKTVRGEDLREKMIESEEYGEQYRAERQGSDTRKPDVDHEKERARTWNKDEPQKNIRPNTH